MVWHRNGDLHVQIFFRTIEIESMHLAGSQGVSLQENMKDIERIIQVKRETSVEEYYLLHERQ